MFIIQANTGLRQSRVCKLHQRSSNISEIPLTTSKHRKIKKGVPLGVVFFSMLFNLYMTSSIPQPPTEIKIHAMTYNFVGNRS